MRIAIIGRSELLYTTVEKIIDQGNEIGLVITSKEAPEYKITNEHYKELANKLQIPYLFTAKINTDEAKNVIKVSGPFDLAVSINYNGIIEGEVIDMFPLGILNAHGGDLPRYRGNACQAWAIINGEDHVTMCIHKMRGGELDNGDIITKENYDLTNYTQIGEVYNWMEAVIPKLMIEAINRLATSPDYILETQSLDPADALRCYPRMIDDAKIDIALDNISIDRLIRASSEPFSGAWCWLDNEKLIIWKAKVFDDQENYLAIPGQIAKINQDGTVEIITGKGKLLLLEIEYDSIRTNMPSKILKSIRKRLK